MLSATRIGASEAQRRGAHPHTSGVLSPYAGAMPVLSRVQVKRDPRAHVRGRGIGTSLGGSATSAVVFVTSGTGWTLVVLVAGVISAWAGVLGGGPYTAASHVPFRHDAVMPAHPPNE